MTMQEMVTQSRWNHMALDLSGTLGEIAGKLAKKMDDIPPGEMLDSMSALYQHVLRVQQEMWGATGLGMSAPGYELPMPGSVGGRLL